MAEAPAELAAEIRDLEQKHAENPEGRYLVALANLYRKAGDLARAELLLRDGLRRHPESLSAHIVLGRCFADRGATRAAADEFRHVLSIDPQNLIALRTLGELAAAEGQRDEAERWYRELLSVDPMNEEARAVLSTLESSAPEPEEEFDTRAAWWEPSESARDAAQSQRASEQPVPEMVSDDSLVEWTEALAEPAPELDAVGAEAPSGPNPEAAGTGETLLDVDLGLGAGIGGLDADSDAGEVVTETIADLYARQGFYERAAEVYRELLRQGDDSRLLLRLAEMEELAASGGQAGPAREPGPGSGAADTIQAPAGVSEAAELPSAVPGDELAGDPFAASFAYGFAGSEPDDEPLAVPAADDQPVRAEDVYAVAEFAATGTAAPDTNSSAGEPLAESGPAELAEPAIRMYLARLLAWTPAPAASELPDAGAAEPVAESGPAEQGSEPAPEPDTAWGAEDVEEVWAGDEPFPWELPPPPADPGEQAGLSSFSFDSFFSEERVTEPDAVVVPGPDLLDTVPAEDAGPPAPDAAAEDEDLESFQAWLRSLRR